MKYRTIVGIWLAWTAVVLVFPVLVTSRFAPLRPDRVLPWTARLTGDTATAARASAAPVLREHAGWDSTYYLTIASGGYDDPSIQTVPSAAGGRVSLTYAFFPLYPLTMRAVAMPLRALGMETRAALISAGVLLSLLGTLAAMLAIATIAGAEDAETGVRAAAYAVIFPGAIFFALVYSDALFAGLAFASLALMRRRIWIAAALAAAATLTRGVGVALAAPLLLSGFLDQRVRSGRVRFVAALAPLAAFAVWRATLGAGFDDVERTYFHRIPFDVPASLAQWRAVFAALPAASPAFAVYEGIELGAIALAAVSIAATWRRYPEAALFSALALAVCVFSVAASSMVRYMAVIPAIPLALAHWGSNAAVDRAWTMIAITLFALLLALFSFGFWVG